MKHEVLEDHAEAHAKEDATNANIRPKTLLSA